MTIKLSDLKVKLFTDGADKAQVALMEQESVNLEREFVQDRRKVLRY